MAREKSNRSQPANPSPKAKAPPDATPRYDPAKLTAAGMAARANRHQKLLDKQSGVVQDDDADPT